MRIGTRQYTAPHVVVIRTSILLALERDFRSAILDGSKIAHRVRSNDPSSSMRRKIPEQPSDAWYVTALRPHAVDPIRRQPLVPRPKPYWTGPIGFQAHFDHRRQILRPGNGGEAGSAVER